MILLTLLDGALSLSIFTIQVGWASTKFVYGLLKPKEKTEYTEERNL